MTRCRELLHYAHWGQVREVSRGLSLLKNDKESIVMEKGWGGEGKNIKCLSLSTWNF